MSRHKAATPTSLRLPHRRLDWMIPRPRFPHLRRGTSKQQGSRGATHPLRMQYSGMASEARAQELDWIRNRGVYEKRPRAEMLAGGARAITLKWIDTDKGDARRPNYRSRLVAREIKAAREPHELPGAAELFSGMPPLESVKALCSLFVSRAYEGEDMCLATYDSSRAHFYGTPLRRLWVELPPEDAVGDKGPVVGLLKRTMYGTVDASARWQSDYAALLTQEGFQQGRSNPSIFWHQMKDIRLLCHGDDFMVVCSSASRLWFEKVLLFQCLYYQQNLLSGHQLK